MSLNKHDAQTINRLLKSARARCVRHHSGKCPCGDTDGGVDNCEFLPISERADNAEADTELEIPLT